MGPPHFGVLNILLLLSAAAEKPSEVPYYGRSPPIYPSPVGNGTTSREWTNAYRRAAALVRFMTVEEKVNVTRGYAGLCVGNTGAVPRFNVPAICMADGPAGIKGIHFAATFDADLIYEYSAALGRKYSSRGINVGLGPVAGPFGKVAKTGRNWEGLNNDPYFAGVGMGAVTRGMQDSGIISTPKHWFFNEQKFRRRQSDFGKAINSNVDNRTLYKFYVWPFMDSLREGAGSVICSYQRANHSYGCQNSKLINGIFKMEFGFEGFVVSDWEAQNSGVASTNAGLDVVMPRAGLWGDKLVETVNNGNVNHKRLDDITTRLLTNVHLLDQKFSYPSPGVYNNLQQHFPRNVQRDHARLIRRIGAAGTVLVKNVNKTLPLKGGPNFLAVYGYNATNRDRYGGGYEVNWGWKTFNGTFITGGGSGGNTPPYVVSPFQALQERASRKGGILRWDFWSEDPETPYVNADAYLVFINAYVSESFNRFNLTDAHSDRLVHNVAGICGNTIVVVHSAGIRTVDAWHDHPNVIAIIFAGLPGQKNGHIIVDVLYGDVNPTGRLPYTIARRKENYGKLLNSSTSFDFFAEDNFDEGLYIDYRAFDKKNIQPLYEFGFGLSYTTFSYQVFSATVLPAESLASSSKLAEYPDPAVRIIQSGHPDLWEKVALERNIVLELTKRDLNVWNVVAQQWRIKRGKYKVFVGASNRNIKFNGAFII
ncbi:hypothetical protein PoMZ_09198 [Pyricularia oryzae]|uniref:Beta-glucosidase cel3A n=1 Tax=Pyricularia oryzae TaxID=318829 RepID=A0A4P7MWC3_PYROR|nr:hypothetical protein PoMZ_09198 [Pyricularia oryzae]